LRRSFAGLDWSHVVQLKSFLEPIASADDARKALQEFFGERPLPVLTFVEWQSPSLPIEIELIAAVPPEFGNKSGRAVEHLTPPGMTASPVFSRVARLRSPAVVYTSGLYGDEKDDPPARVREILGQVRQLVICAGGNCGSWSKTYYVVSDETVPPWARFSRNTMSPTHRRRPSRLQLKAWAAMVTRW
jgi:enamine deaminase RidA (YjgF/YER057c/UK114 family)